MSLACAMNHPAQPETVFFAGFYFTGASVVECEDFPVCVSRHGMAALNLILVLIPGVSKVKWFGQSSVHIGAKRLVCEHQSHHE